MQPWHEQAVELRKADPPATLSEIAEKFKVTRQAVWYVMKNAGLVGRYDCRTRLGERVKKKCKGCGKPMSLIPSASKTVYCTAECMWKKRGKRKAKKCSFCKQDMMLLSSEMKRKYCGTKCRDQARAKGYVRVCQDCGDQRPVNSKRMARSKRCSKCHYGKGRMAKRQNIKESVAQVAASPEV